MQSPSLPSPPRSRPAEKRIDMRTCTCGEQEGSRERGGGKGKKANIKEDEFVTYEGGAPCAATR